MEKLSSVLEELREKDENERKAYEYFCRNGKYADALELMLSENCYGGDCGIISEKIKTALEKTDNGAYLTENYFIGEGRNVELNRVQRYVDLKKHKHDFFEAVAVLSGSCSHLIENQEVEMLEGDVIVVPPEVAHRTVGRPDSIAVNIKIRKSAFRQALSPLVHSANELGDYLSQIMYSKQYRNYLFAHTDCDELYQTLVLSMFSLQKELNENVNAVLEALLSAFFSYLVKLSAGKLEISSAQKDRNLLMARIESAVYGDFKSLTLSALAKAFYVSEGYMSQLVKKQTGKTFAALVREIKLDNAKRLLENTPMTVGAVCLEVGYRDTTQFIRSFLKRYGVTPKQYRQSSKTLNY